MSRTSLSHRMDIQWFRRHLLEDILPRWHAAITDTGLFQCHFDHAWRPEPQGFGTLVSQTRLIYNFAQGHALTGDQMYADAVEAGARFLVEHFWDDEYGGWVRACSPQGDIVDDVKDSYGHAFVIFGLAHALTVTGQARLQEALHRTWEVFATRFRDGHGGYRYIMSRDFRHTDPLRSQNPLMHLFEALLAAGDIAGLETMHQEAVTLADFILHRLVRPEDRVLPEVYDPDWQPLPASREGRIDIGHAFEWAFLLSSAAERGLSPAYRTAAADFLDCGMRLGFDSDAGGIFSPAAPDGRLVNRRKGWWEQCETVRALLHFAVFHDREDLWAPLRQTLAFIQAEFLDPVHGGWYGSREPGMSPEGQPKGNEVKLDYHVAGMCMEGIHIAEVTAVD